MERRFLSADICPVKLEKRGDLESMFGYAAVFYDPTDPGTTFEIYSDLCERIMPTAFDRALREGQDVRCLRNHSPDMLLGRTSAATCRLATDTRGLSYDCTPGDTTVARDTCDMIKRGDMTGSSFSFSVVKQAFVTMEDMDVREIHDVDLWDVGPVTYPAYEGSSAGVRSKELVAVPEEVRSAHLAWKEEKAKERAKSRVVVPRSVVMARARTVEIELAG